ncbi:transglutaminase-like domain-containing protein [Microbacterium xanthum]|uniref:transglutaminase-like domain-containing protein n=1 Tax=Microbacterium xanthum TaxID=3079794 RepID=UPI002AD40F0F|nr:transglutaminase family protein [Microbacterium sp. KSW-48]MDZ8170955.1 transglutaminase family protein [Microbacterium sp. KSW-48]
MQRNVSAHIALDVTGPAELVFAISVSRHHTPEETLTVLLDGTPLGVDELPDAHGTRLHRVRSDSGRLELSYEADVAGTGDTDTATDTDLVTYLRPSRYAESDALAPTAAAEFAGIDPGPALLKAVSSWVGTRLSYAPGSSLPTDGAVRTLLNRRGVCRDYAHTCVALLRALGVPARLVAVYAPGLDPMDFHAVAEAWIDGAWRVVDATTLAPRATLLRIATGRDAADTAFLTVTAGGASLVSMEVSATADRLPDDDLERLVGLT